MGYFVDVFDLWVFNAVRNKSLTELGFSGDARTTAGVALINAQTLGLMIGGIIFGMLGDKRGRLSVLLGSILLYSLSTLLNGFVHSFDQYLLCRFFGGLGLAGEIGGGITLVAEVVPRQFRGYATTLVASVGVSGAIAAGLVGDALPWRYAYFLGGGAGIALLFLRASLMESSIFKLTHMKKDLPKGSLRLLLASRERAFRYFGCIAAGIPIYFCAGCLAVFAPEISIAMGAQEAASVGKSVAAMSISMAIMDLVAGLMSQWLKSRKLALNIFIASSIILSMVFLSQREMSPQYYYLWCSAIGATIGYWAVLITCTAEQFGTNLRSLATTTVPNFVRGASIPLTLGFEFLRRPLGVIPTLEILCIISGALALLGVKILRETFNVDLAFIELKEGGQISMDHEAKAA